MKSVSPFCVQMRCICHSMTLCIEHAASKLPSNVGLLLSEIPHWFYNSDLRRESFKLLYSVMNQETDHEPARTAPLPFGKTLATRWLVRGKVMFNILMNWEELKVYFSSFENSRERSDVRYKARLIKDMLMDGVNYFHFVFAFPIVFEKKERILYFSTRTQTPKCSTMN